MLLFEISGKVAYHGTSSDRATKILDNGFSLDTLGEKTNDKISGVSMTIDRAIATEHAEYAAEEFGGDPVVLSVDISHLNIADGNKTFALWDKLGSLASALRHLRKQFDGAELFYKDEGIEEFEIIGVDPKKISKIVTD